MTQQFKTIHYFFIFPSIFPHCFSYNWTGDSLSRPVTSQDRVKVDVLYDERFAGEDGHLSLPGEDEPGCAAQVTVASDGVFSRH